MVAEGHLAFSIGSHAVGDVDAPAPVFQHGEDDLGGILQVGVDDDDGIAGGLGQTSGGGCLLSEIAGQGDDPPARQIFSDDLQPAQ